MARTYEEVAVLELEVLLSDGTIGQVLGRRFQGVGDPLEKQVLYVHSYERNRTEEWNFRCINRIDEVVSVELSRREVKMIFRALERTFYLPSQVLRERIESAWNDENGELS